MATKALSVVGKLLDLEMMVFLHSFERTESEYRALYKQAGVEMTHVVPTNSPYSVIEGVSSKQCGER